MKTNLLAGVSFGIPHFAILTMVDFLWLPEIEISQPFAELAAGTLVGAVLYSAACILLSMIGGWLSSLFVTDQADP